MADKDWVKQEKQWAKEINFEFFEGEIPDGINDLKLDDEVTIIIRGKIKRIESTKVEGANKANIKVERRSIAIQGTKKLSLNDAAENDEKRRRR